MQPVEKDLLVVGVAKLKGRNESVVEGKEEIAQLRVVAAQLLVRDRLSPPQDFCAQRDHLGLEIRRKEERPAPGEHGDLLDSDDARKEDVPRLHVLGSQALADLDLPAAQDVPKDESLARPAGDDLVETEGLRHRRLEDAPLERVELQEGVFERQPCQRFREVLAHRGVHVLRVGRPVEDEPGDEKRGVRLVGAPELLFVVGPKEEVGERKGDPLLAQGFGRLLEQAAEHLLVGVAQPTVEEIEVRAVRSTPFRLLFHDPPSGDVKPFWAQPVGESKGKSKMKRPLAA